MKHILSILCVLALLVCLLPAAYAEGLSIYINGVEVTPENNTVVCGNGTATVEFPISDDEEAYYTLTLNNATITNAVGPFDFLAAGIYLEGKDVRLVLNGSNTVRVSAPQCDSIYGLNTGALTICGNGSLNVFAEKAKYSSYGIYADDTVLITDEADVCTYAGNTPYNSCGLKGTLGHVVPAVELCGNGKFIAYGKTKALSGPVARRSETTAYKLFVGSSAPGKQLDDNIIDGDYSKREKYIAAHAILPYQDVAAESWYFTSVNYCNRNGLMNGVSDNGFSPDAATSRAMLVTVLHRMSGLPMPTGTGLFSDVTADDWFADAVNWAADNEIVNGIGEGRFHPNGSVTREQLATILYRYCQYAQIETSQQAAELSGYSDKAAVSAWATDAMQWAVAEGLINGSDGKLLPQGNATRAQVAAILMRFAEKFA